MKRYKVTGDQAVLGDKQPGETFDAVLAEDQEKFLIQIGAIRVVSSDVEQDDRIKDKQTKPRKKA